MLELLEGANFNLSDALPGHLELLAELLQGVRALPADAEAQLDHLALSQAQRLKDILQLVSQHVLGDAAGWRVDAIVFDEVAESAVLVVTDGAAERNRRLG